MSIITIPFRGETKKLNDETRATLPGQFITLPEGVTHYEIGGPDDGAKVVLIHGFSVPYFIWDPTYDALTVAGYRVLRYDLYGRGYSDRPHVKYNHDLFDRQLSDLLSALEFNTPVNIIGLSMGGVIAATFTARHPKMVKKIGLIDPAGFPIDFPRIIQLVRVPVIGEVLFILMGGEFLIKGIAKDFFDPKDLEMFSVQYREAMQYKGFLRAILSTIRTGVAEDDLGAYKQIARSGHATILFWGREDKTIAFKYSQKLIEFIPQIEFHPIDDCGHIPHFERPEILNPLLIEYLGR
ncbi:MAG: alpha/beta hydrolase [Chloroflexi bacterium]|nr:alpha/beta hydrolase [Chloroflexota bacterium]